MNETNGQNCSGHDGGCCGGNKTAHVIIGIIGALVLVILGVYLFGLARNAWKANDYIGKSPDYKNIISVDGTGKVTAKPDVAVINIGVIAEATTVAKAQKDSADKMNAITKAIKDEFKIEDKDLQTTNYSVNPKYDWTSGTQKIIGYTVNQSLTVKVRNLDKAGDVLARATDLGANSVNGPQFTIDDPTALRAQAREQAIKQAKDKARVISDQVGVGLGRIIGFTEGMTGGPVNYYTTDAVGLGMGGASPKMAPAPAIEAGSQEITVSVSISYEIR